MQKKSAISPPPDLSTILENCVGCKWTLHILHEIRKGVSRPGAIARSKRGLTTKVMNERLVKLVRFGLLEKEVFPETPPRVEYRLTAFGKKFVEILDQIETLRIEMC